MKIAFREVHFAYSRFGEIAAAEQNFELRGLSFEISSSEFVAVAGRSGSGKTTLLQMFNGLLRPTRGVILVDGRDIHAPGFALAALRQRLGLAFQFPETQLFAATVREDVGFAPKQQALPAPERMQRTHLALRDVGLSEDFLERDPFTLSEGEKRRVALAGILAMHPALLILDEPTAGLDARGVAEIGALLQRWHRDGRGLVMISHDTDLIAALAQRVLVLHNGALLFDGAPHELWAADPGKMQSSSAEICSRAGLAWPRADRLKQKLRALHLDAEIVASA